MIDKYKVLCIIPARGGSKGIPLKNLYPIRGIPLLGYVLGAAKASHYIDTIMVSTDDIRIATYAQEQGVAIPYMRPEHLASDTATTIAVVHHALSWYYTHGEEYDIVLTLQPTQPLVQSWHIDEALEQYSNDGVSLLGISPQKVHPLLLRTLDSNRRLTPLLKERNSTVRRQDMEQIYCVNGMLYINSAKEILASPTLSLNDNLSGYVIDTMYYIDIDSLEDITLCMQKMDALY